jgi:hypothetical protein
MQHALVYHHLQDLFINSDIDRCKLLTFHVSGCYFTAAHCNTLENVVYCHR